METQYDSSDQGSTDQPAQSRHWCGVCGDDIQPASNKRAPIHCSDACVEWDINDARQQGDFERLRRLYTLRAKRRAAGKRPPRPEVHPVSGKLILTPAVSS